MEQQNHSDIDYELFFSLHLDLLAISDQNGVLLKLNDAWYDVLGYTPEELLGVNFFDIMHPEDLAASLNAASDISSGTVVLSFTNRYLHKNGEYRHLEWNSQLIDGYIYGSGRDVTSFKDREEGLKRDQMRLQAMIESQTNYLIRIDLNHCYNFANKKYIEDFAWCHGTDNLVGVDSRASTLPDSLIQCNSALLYALENPGETVQVELLKPLKDGTIATTLWECMCISDTDGKPSEIQCLGVNITERKLLENQEKLAQESALLEMSTPITQLWDGILLLPLVGMVTAARAQNVMSSVLKKIADTQSKVLILDISGVPVVDTEVANHFIRLSKATRLMGCLCTMSGISPAVSQTIVELGIQIEEINTTGTMRDALEKALVQTGSKLVSIKDHKDLAI